MLYSVLFYLNSRGGNSKTVGVIQNQGYILPGGNIKSTLSYRGGNLKMGVHQNRYTGVTKYVVGLAQ